MIKKIPIKEKIGRMLQVGFRGLEVDENHPIARDIRSYSLGSTILFDVDIAAGKKTKNIQSPSQVKKLIHELKQLTTGPLFVSIDQEGGKVSRLKEKYGFPKTVSHGYLGEMDDLSLTADHAGEIARTLCHLGINLNFAPVVDVNVNPGCPAIGKFERSFSADPDKVTAHAVEFINAHHKEGIRCTLKHFPGHGSSVEDTHLGFVDITETWTEKELVPYIDIIPTGEVDAIMTSHVFNAKLDPQYPATLSKRIITGILRERLQFDGVVFSDDMQMCAITDNYSLETAVLEAINAGVDILTFGNNLNFDEEITPKVVSSIMKFIEEGKLSEKRIDESYQRIRKLEESV